MKKNELGFEIGALLYCPANKLGVADAVINESFGTKYSLALCLEDTIGDSHVKEAETILADTIKKIHNAFSLNRFYLPKIFIRVRYPEQINTIVELIGNGCSILCGIIFPKFSLHNADKYIDSTITASNLTKKKLHMMPILESGDIIDLRCRFNILYEIKNKLERVKDFIPNIRVGGNDLCNTLGLRRHVDETIYSIRPIANILSDIITVFGTDYVVSGPVWEYYKGPHWDTGMKMELLEDKQMGFIGKTVIHPNQISLVNEAYSVSTNDSLDADAILGWSNASQSYVTCSKGVENTAVRMNEYKTHYNWAENIFYQRRYFGINNNWNK